jgi:hypothetical protein
MIGAFHGTKFETDSVMTRAVRTDYANRTRHGTKRAYASRCRKAVEVDGEFVEK